MKKVASNQDLFVEDIRIIIETGKANAIKSVDFCRVKMYWNIGRRIFEEEQHGKERADYGTYLLANLAKVRTGIRKWFLKKAVGTGTAILSTVSNCVYTADAIKLVSI